MAGLDEFALIRLLTERRQDAGRLRANGVETGIGDDAAVVNVTPGFQLVLSCDTMVEGIHFAEATMSDADIGFKAMASSISDMAAMGAIPRYALVSLTAARGTDPARLERMYAGLYECADRYGVEVVGGDTTSAKAGLVISVTVTGEVEAGRALCRSGAKPGDVVFVTGPLGGSAGGLDFLLGAGVAAEDKAGSPDSVQSVPSGQTPAQEQPARQLTDTDPDIVRLIRCHQRPLPQVEAGRLLAAGGACRSLNDISDGLASEAAEIAGASGVGILLDASAIPLEPGLAAYAAMRGWSALDWALFGGEDYQLVGTLAPEKAAQTASHLRRHGIPLAIIGSVTDAFRGVRLRRADGTAEELTGRGYNHFA